MTSTCIVITPLYPPSVKSDKNSTLSLYLWGYLGHTWGYYVGNLGESWVISGGYLRDTFLGYLCDIWGKFGDIWRYLGKIWGISRAYLGYIWRIPGGYLRYILGISGGCIWWTNWGYFGDILGIFWWYLEDIWGIFWGCKWCEWGNIMNLGDIQGISTWVIRPRGPRDF